LIFRIFITGSGISQVAQDLLQENNCVFQVGGPNDSSSEIANKLKVFNPDGIIVRQGEITREVQAAAPNLKVISKHGTGTDNIDIDAASERRIAVMFTPLANYESVAEHTLALMLSLTRRVTIEDRRIRKGVFDKNDYGGLELSGKTLGIVGFGHAGRRLSELVAPFNMTAMVYHPSRSEEPLPQHVSKVQNVEELFPVSDIISLHCPLTSETSGMINSRSIALMKKGAFLVNTSRGGIVNESDLIHALQNRHICGAALDVFESEPPKADSPLLTMDNVILTPHIAGISDRSFVNMGMAAVHNALAILQGDSFDQECLKNKEIIG